MKTGKRQILAALFLAALLFPARGAVPAAAAGWESGPEILSCAAVPIFMGESYVGAGYVTDSVTLVPLRNFAEYLLKEDFQTEWDQQSRTAVLSAEGLTISITLGNRYMDANGRLLYLGDDVYNVNGTILVPIREVARIFGLELQWDMREWAVYIDDSHWQLLESGDSYYDPDTLFWLARVIWAEAENQPLEGMIGVGNVVLNRLYDPSGSYGDTVAEVIFQRGQFDVVSSGRIYCEATEKAEAAAKLSLEGYNTVGESKWFVNPVIGDPTWMRSCRTFHCAIADHEFYT